MPNIPQISLIKKNSTDKTPKKAVRANSALKKDLAKKQQEIV